MFLLFSVIPVLEIYLFVLVGERIGALNTIGIVILTAIGGAWLARSQGTLVLSRIRSNLAAGIPPGEDMLEGALILVAGLVLLTPGFFTDAIGFVLLIPATRARLRVWLGRKFREWTAGGKVTIIRR
ncbi:MAG: FxsA family protein [Desulfovibrio sp.]|uniref:FxsA family protein n=1 Tax=Desulfovibrio sp. 7SRBS1 TaxID=3378064 RepID=UPI003B3E2704